MKLLCVLFFTLLSAPLFAQDTPTPTTYDFEPDKVDGAILKPLGEGITHVPHGKTSSLINIRADFVETLVKSVEDI